MRPRIIRQQPTAEMVALLKRAGDNDFQIARAAQEQLAVGLTLPLKQGVMKGEIINGIYESIFFQPGTSTEFPLDFVAPGNESDFIAWTLSNHGRIPENAVQGDYVMVPTYDVGASIDFLLKYARDARWDIVGRAMEVLEAMYVRKANDDGWKVILTAGKNRGIMVYDDAATAGLFTKRLVSLARTTMRRNAGGNTASINKGRLTDWFVSPEGAEDMRTWDLTQVDDLTRREILLSRTDNTQAPISVMFDVVINVLDELGVAQEYQNYFSNTLSGSLAASDVELCVGLDLSKNDSFVMPVREEVRNYPDETLHRQRRMGWYGWGEHGFGCLDARRVILGSF